MKNIKYLILNKYSIYIKYLISVKYLVFSLCFTSSMAIANSEREVAMSRFGLFFIGSDNCAYSHLAIDIVKQWRADGFSVITMSIDNNNIGDLPVDMVIDPNEYNIQAVPIFLIYDNKRQMLIGQVDGFDNRSFIRILNIIKGAMNND